MIAQKEGGESIEGFVQIMEWARQAVSKVVTGAQVVLSATIPSCRSRATAGDLSPDCGGGGCGVASVSCGGRSPESHKTWWHRVCWSTLHWELL